MTKPFFHSGFTLIEIMIALLILSVIGIMIVAGLNLVVRSQERFEELSDAISLIQNAFMTIERDIQQTDASLIFTLNKEEIPTFSISQTSLEFTRSVPIHLKSINQPVSLLRVTYQLRSQSLIRVTRPIINHIMAEEKIVEPLLSHIKSFHCYMLPANNLLTETKAEASQHKQDKNFDIALVIELDTKELGHIRRIMRIPITTKDEDPNAI